MSVFASLGTTESVQRTTGVVGNLAVFATHGDKMAQPIAGKMSSKLFTLVTDGD